MSKDFWRKGSNIENIWIKNLYTIKDIWVNHIFSYLSPRDLSRMRSISYDIYNFINRECTGFIQVVPTFREGWRLCRTKLTKSNLKSLSNPKNLCVRYMTEAVIRTPAHILTGLSNLKKALPDSVIVELFIVCSTEWDVMMKYLSSSGQELSHIKVLCIQLVQTKGSYTSMIDFTAFKRLEKLIINVFPQHKSLSTLPESTRCVQFNIPNWNSDIYFPGLFDNVFCAIPSPHAIVLGNVGPGKSVIRMMHERIAYKRFGYEAAVKAGDFLCTFITEKLPNFSDRAEYINGKNPMGTNLVVEFIASMRYIVEYLINNGGDPSRHVNPVTKSNILHIMLKHWEMNLCIQDCFICSLDNAGSITYMIERFDLDCSSHNVYGETPCLIVEKGCKRPESERKFLLQFLRDRVAKQGHST